MRPSAADRDFTHDPSVLVNCWIHERPLYNSILGIPGDFAMSSEGARLSGS
jgi:hypothetical protein